MTIKRLNKAHYSNKLAISIFFIVITLSCNLTVVQALAGPVLPGQYQQPQGKIANSPPQDTSNVSFGEILGGSGSSYVSDVAFDANGNMYITGSTNSTNFPIKDAYQTTLKGSSDVFLAKFNATGSLVMSTYFGGSRYDWSSSLTIDSAGNIYITGYTNSKDFPTKNAYQQNLQGFYNVFVAKFNHSGQLLFSTYIGGSQQGFSGSIAVDSLGNIIIIGSTGSSDFPLVSPLNYTFPSQTMYQIGFVAKFNNTGTLTFSTLLSGNDTNEFGLINGIVVDSSDNYYVTGVTNSQSFPIKNAYQSNFTTIPDTTTGHADAFITKFNSTNSIVFSTFLGGSTFTEANSIAIDQPGNIFVTGTTDSSNFPIKNGYDTFNGSNDVFLSKFSSTGQLLYSTLLGGKGYDVATQVAVGPSDTIFLIGTTNSTDFPTRNAYQSSFKGSERYSRFRPFGGDMFLVEFTNNGTFAYGTYLGGSKNDFGISVSVDSSGDIYIAGNTDSTTLPLKGPYNTFSGSTDVYIAKFIAVPFSFPIKPHTIDFVSLIIITGSSVVLLTFSLYILVEYRQYRKTDRGKKLYANTKVKTSFRAYLQEKMPRKPSRQVNKRLSDKSLEILEETLEETKSEN